MTTYTKTGDPEQEISQTYFARAGSLATVHAKALDGLPADAIPVTRVTPEDMDIHTANAVRIIEAYCQRKGHMPMGTVLQLAEASGVTVIGELALVDAREPSIVLFPHLTLEGVRLIQHLAVSEITHWHPATADIYRELDTQGLYPKGEPADVHKWNEDEPQEQANTWYWLPLVLCAEREGDARFRVSESPLHSLVSFLQRLFADTPDTPDTPQA